MTEPSSSREAATRPLVNLRFTTSFPALAETLGLTRETTLVNSNDFYGERYPYGVVVPGGDRALHDRRNGVVSGRVILATGRGGRRRSGRGSRV